MTDWRVLSEEEANMIIDAIMVYRSSPPEDELRALVEWFTKREVDMQRQVSELTQERDQLKRDNKDLNKRVHQMNGAGSYLAISTADLEQALRDVRFTVNDDSRPLENRMARVDYIVKQALSKQARQEDVK